MVEYIALITVASVFIGVLEYMFYSSRMRDAAKFCAALILLHATLMPILGFAHNVKSGEFTLDLEFKEEYESDGEYLKIAEEAFCDGISKLLYTKFNIKEENAEIIIEGFRFENMKAEKITVILSGRASYSDWRAVEEYLNESGLGKCEVNIRIG